MTIKAKREFIIVILLLIILQLQGVLAMVGPQAWVFEDVSADFWANGSVKSLSRTGSIRVSVPNDGDVLQQVRVNISDTFIYTRTNITNQTAYRNVVTSYPNANSTTSLYVNLSDTVPVQSTIYDINDSDAAPTINLSVEYKNLFGGGRDLFDEDNLLDSVNYIEMNFSIENPSSTRDLNSVSVIIQFERDTNGGADSVNIFAVPTADSGTPGRTDTDSDSDYDRATWSGNLVAGAVVNMTVNLSIEELDNLADSTTSINLDLGTDGPIADKGMNSSYFTTNSLSGITIESRFSKGAIRQGLDMKQNASNDWGVRGFIRNMGGLSVTSGYNLTYNITEWRVYSIDPNIGAPYTSPNQTGNFDLNPYLTVSDGRIYTNDNSRSNITTWFETGETTKPYFSIFFNWSVIWDTEDNDNNVSYINTTLDLPVMYKVDMANTKNIISGVINPDSGGEPVSLEDNTTFLGHANAPVDFVEMFIQIPSNTSAGDFHGGFEINTSSLELWFINDSGSTRLNISADQTAINISIINVSIYGDYNGSINISVWNIWNAEIYGNSDIVNQYIDDTGSNDGRLAFYYTVTSNQSMTTGDSYVFTGNTTMRTLSWTHITETQPVQTISVSARRLVGYKDLIVYDPSQPTIVNGTIRVEVQGQSISGIKFMDYVPNGTDFNLSNVTVRFYNGTWNTWSIGDGDYNITENGSVTLSDGLTVMSYEFVNGSTEGSTFTLSDGEIIEVSYQLNITQEGIWELPVQIFALDPETGEEFRAIAYSFVRIDIPPDAVSFQITEDDFSLGKRVVVGNPVMWVKTFDVYNPNSRPVTGSFQTEIFPDVINYYVSYYNDAGERVEEQLREATVNGKRMIIWESKLSPLETRSYEVRIFTPPILEIDRDVEVLEQMENRMVKLKMDIYLKNFANEDYSNVVLNIPISYEKLIEVRDGFGERLQFSGDSDTSTIILGDVKGGEDDLMTVTIIYRESYPLVVVTPDRDRYNVNSPVGLEILVINGGENVDYPYLEIEIYTEDMDLVHANIQKLESMEPLEKTEFYEKFIIPAQAPSGEYIASVKFREDFVNLASTTGNFIVIGPAGTIPESLQVILLLAVTGVLVYLSQKRLKEVRRINNKLRGV